MDVKVRFRFNKITGEIDVFDVEDEGTMRLPEAEHNREHDRIAADLGRVIERNPQVVEMLPGHEVPLNKETTQKPEDEQTVEIPVTRFERQR